MEAPRQFLDVPALLGQGWQLTPAAQTERGEWFVSVRHGPNGLVETFYAGDTTQALLRVCAHVGAVNELMRRAGR